MALVGSHQSSATNVVPPILGLNERQLHWRKDDGIETDDEELDFVPGPDLTPAEIQREEQIAQVLRRMDPAESWRAILAASQSSPAPEAPSREVSPPLDAPRRPINRKERRARQRLLAKKLRKAK
jgi:hypothetical protein